MHGETPNERMALRDLFFSISRVTCNAGKIARRKSGRRQAGSVKHYLTICLESSYVKKEYDCEERPGLGLPQPNLGCVVMILSFRSRPLRRFWERDDASKLPQDRIERIAMILDRLDAAVQAQDLNLPGLQFHQLSGTSKGRFAVSVSANWRITFGWNGEDAIAVDFEDYH